MNLNIFNLFDDNDDGRDGDADNEEYKAAKELGRHLEIVGDTIEFNLLMFTKLIQNNIVFNEKLKKFFKDIGKDFDEKATKKASEFTVFNRSWSYLKKVDVDTDEFTQVILEHDLTFVQNSLERALKFFESSEEYEKCAHIHKILKVVKAV